MENDKEIKNILNIKKSEDKDIEEVKVKDGLFENTVVNKKYVTKDGRQLLKEITFEN